VKTASIVKPPFPSVHPQGLAGGSFTCLFMMYKGTSDEGEFIFNDYTDIAKRKAQRGLPKRFEDAVKCPDYST
jgi:hypothetical protein